MKKVFSFLLLFGVLIIAIASCKKEQPAAGRPSFMQLNNAAKDTPWVSGNAALPDTPWMHTAATVADTPWIHK
jgi:hypothetical protein